MRSSGSCEVPSFSYAILYRILPSKKKDPRRRVCDGLPLEGVGNE